VLAATPLSMERKPATRGAVPQVAA
jgi:hypothetical protein